MSEEGPFPAEVQAGFIDPPRPPDGGVALEVKVETALSTTGARGTPYEWPRLEDLMNPLHVELNTLTAGDNAKIDKPLTPEEVEKIAARWEESPMAQARHDIGRLVATIRFGVVCAPTEVIPPRPARRRRPAR